MANTVTGNKNKPKNNSGLMDSFLQKDQIVTPLNNKRQSNVLSPLEEEKSKAKKKNLKSTDHEKEAGQAEEKPKKIKGKWKSGKQNVEHMQEICNTPIPSATSKTVEEKISEHDIEIENHISQVNQQRSCNNTTNTTPDDELKAIIGSLIEEMRSLRHTVHHDIRDLQNAISQQKVDITQMEQSVRDTKHEIKKFLTEKIDNNAQNIQSIMDENKILKRENDKLKERMSKLEKVHLENNILISGQPEEAWESNDRTKEIVLDTIIASQSPSQREEATRTVKTVEIASCK